METNFVEFVKSLGIDIPGTLDGSKYIIELSNSNEYSKMYTLLDKSPEVDLEEELTLVTDKVGELIFYGDEFEVKLVGNFASDIYRIIIERLED
jgi:uncharacterized HAD superfamily protein